MNFWQVFYDWCVIPLGWIVVRMYGMINEKARRAIDGRADLFERLRSQIALLAPHSTRVWFHSSSLGEFEQAKPIIAELKRIRPDVDVIVSFFSPSGYEHSLTYKLASLITYIPFDSKQNAERFIELIQPSAAVILRYDVWPNHIWELKEKKIPILLASATLHKSTSRMFPFFFQFHRSLYNCINFILTVSEEDKQVFEAFRLTNPILHVIGDTRYDQVMRRSKESQAKHVLPPRIVDGKKILVIGSSWTDDEKHLLPACLSLLSHTPNMLIILVPHEPNEENLERVEYMLNGRASHRRFSELNDYRNEQCIIIDSVGILMALYQYAHVAYVGGSFGNGIHNVLEPAAYGVPIVFGPRYENSQEASTLLREGGAFVGESTEMLLSRIRRLFENEALRVESGKKALALVERNTGATTRFLMYLDKVLEKVSVQQPR
jgi:3-deoxy-D-manno-octulosonic-acid transferase